MCIRDRFKADLLDFIRTQEEPIISSGPYAQYQVMREATKLSLIHISEPTRPY